MSTANKLSYLNDTKSLLRTSLNKFGSSILSTDTFRSYDTKLNEIYDKLPKVTQSGAGFTLTPVQNGQVDDFKMIGTDLEQNTTTGKQLLNIPDGTYSSNGVTAVVKDGIVTLNGTAGNGKCFIKIPFIFNFEDTKTYTLSANNEDVIGGSSYDVSYSAIRFDLSDGSSSTLTWCYFGTKNNNRVINMNYNAVIFCIRTGAGLTYNNFVIKPQLEEGSSSTSFEPYTEGPSPNPDYPQDIKVVEGRQVITDKGKNLLDSSKIQTLTQNGITCTYNSEKQEITFNGTCTSDNTLFYFNSTNIYAKKNITKFIAYYVSGAVENYVKLRFYDSNYVYGVIMDIINLNSSNDKITMYSDDRVNTSNYTINSFRFNNGSVATNFKIKVMVTDDGNTDYEPYHDPVDYNIDLTNDLLKYNKCDFTPTTTSWYFLDSSGSAFGKNIGTKTNIKFPVEINKTYTFRYNISIAPNAFQLCYENENVVATLGKSIGNNTFTFTSDRNGYVIPRVRVQASSQIKITDISVVKGEEDYYDYKLAKIPNTDYKNRIYKSNGNWYFEENVKNIVLDGSEEITIQNIGTDNWYYQLSVNCYKTEQLKQMCSHYNNSGIYNSNTYQGIMMLTEGNFVRIRYGEEDTLANFKMRLSNNNVELWYPLINSITTQITNTTLINQLEAISVHTGTNIITLSSDNNMTPQIEITRLKELERLS